MFRGRFLISDKGVFTAKKVLTTFGFSQGEEEDQVYLCLHRCTKNCSILTEACLHGLGKVSRCKDSLNTEAMTKSLSGKMSKDYTQTGVKKAKPESVFQKFRSPCIDAHYEAFVLQSSLTVGSLYAANLNLGQSYVKQVREIEKQRKVWLSRKEKEQETMQKRFEALKIQAKHCFHSDSLTEGKDALENRKSSRQRAATVSAYSRIASLERKLNLFERREHFRINRSTSQSARHRFNSACSTTVNSSNASFESQSGKRTQSLPFARSTDCSFASVCRSGPSLRRTTSVLSSDGRSTQCREPEQNLSANIDLIPKWLPSNLRSKSIREKSLI